PHLQYPGSPPSDELSSLAAANRSVAEYDIPESYCSRVLPCHIPQHQVAHTKMVKQALKAVARQNNCSYPSVVADFVSGNNPSCTQCFWENFYRLFPESPWHYVSFCHSCRHFDLYATEAEMLADDPHRF